MKRTKKSGPETTVRPHAHRVPTVAQIESLKVSIRFAEEATAESAAFIHRDVHRSFNS